MIKKDIYGDTLKSQLLESAKDRMVQFLLADGAARGAVVHGTKLVNEMRANHGLGILETLVLGHAYMGALLTGSSLKGDDRVAVKIDCEGPIRGLSVEANTFGEVRGYLLHTPIPVQRPLESFDLSPFFGQGVLSVTKYLSKFARPFTGRVELRYGNIGQDLAYFSVKSAVSYTHLRAHET